VLNGVKCKADWRCQSMCIYQRLLKALTECKGVILSSQPQVGRPMFLAHVCLFRLLYIHNLISIQRPRSTCSSCIVTLARPPSSSALKIPPVGFAAFNSITLVCSAYWLAYRLGFRGNWNSHWS